MKTDEIKEAKLQQKQIHQEHMTTEFNYSCIFCYSLTKYRKHEFNKFWDWLQINYSALLITRISQQLFTEIITLRRNNNNENTEEIQRKTSELLRHITYSSFINLDEITDKTLDILNKKNNFGKTRVEKFQKRVLRELEHFGSDIGSETETEEFEEKSEPIKNINTPKESEEFENSDKDSDSNNS